MSANHLTISNTGSIGGGLKVAYQHGSWRKYKPAKTTFVGLDGTTSQAIGTSNTKWIFEATLLVWGTGQAGYASLEGTGQCVEQWLAPSVASLCDLKMTDPGGTDYDVYSVSEYKPVPATGLTASNEMYRVPVRFMQA